MRQRIGYRTIGYRMLTGNPDTLLSHSRLPDTVSVSFSELPVRCPPVLYSIPGTVLEIRLGLQGEGGGTRYHAWP